MLLLPGMTRCHHRTNTMTGQRHVSALNTARQNTNQCQRDETSWSHYLPYYGLRCLAITLHTRACLAAAGVKSIICGVIKSQTT